MSVRFQYILGRFLLQRRCPNERLMRKQKMCDLIIHRPRSPPKNRIKLPPNVLLRHLPMGSRHLLGGRGIDPGPKIAKILIKKIDLLRLERSNRTRPRQAAPRVVGSQTLRAHRGPHEFSKGSQPTAEQSMEQAPSLDPVGERGHRGLRPHRHGHSAHADP